MYTEQQREIIEHTPSNTSIYASPGSGKTTVLTEHIAWQLKHRHVPAGRMLALTFTRQSALDMKQRMRKRGLADGDVGALPLGTFHSQAFRMLLAHTPNIPVILGQLEQRQLMRAAAQKFGVGDMDTVRRLLLANTRKKSVWPVDSAMGGVEGAVLTRYEHMKARAHRWDFDDILVAFAQTLEEHGAELPAFDYLLVDEYQDTNPIQWAIVRLLVHQSRCPVFVVGDDDQSIYGFRGASPSGLLDFQLSYHDARCHRLSTNFRSDRSIVLAAVRLIAHNRHRMEKQMQAFSAAPGRCGTHLWPSEAAEAVGVAGLVRQARRYDSGADVAILARTRRQLLAAWRACQGVVPDAMPQFRTFHDAKGKEWDIVHIVGAVAQNPYLANDDTSLFRRKKSAPALDGQAEEEERRLFYVAMTRARHVLWVHAPKRCAAGKARLSPYAAEAGLRTMEPG
ncbi:ATP-dependent helicase [Alicyclobacillus cycloheptanicus]|uniref:DNA 3'-5' helicase n=1 Tax=Alicyclobacillus cycloheptanicus TaxID=1457 RepID=A0ABT9XDU2_9BACL|nr:ATP-dependent helicase [Alicyclobacillus cycloheptanicus]MDQ0188467.1 DNA helicase-2/ATP-dependent DNA helicase PcrA [Alicyclobacillus cycloheptanicus]WDM01159.1 ATP-dependent helicase [Alicyclobacillus cycloheptanicus]